MGEHLPSKHEALSSNLKKRKKKKPTVIAVIKKKRYTQITIKKSRVLSIDNINV
jgi:hypothetical protein